MISIGYNSLDKDNFPYFLRKETFLNDAVIRKIANYQQAGVILNKFFAESSRGFSFSSVWEQAPDILALFWVKLYQNTNLSRMSGESIQIMLNETYDSAIYHEFRKIILVRHEVLLDINSDMLSILEMMKSYGLEDGFCLSAIKQNALAYEAMPEIVKSNVDFTVQAIECNPRIEPFLSESIKEQLPLKTKILLWQSSVATSVSSIFSSASTKANPTSVISSEVERSPAT